jgi:DNA-binding NtrC family response regulator
VSDEATLSLADSLGGAPQRGDAGALALVVVWCAGAPGRAGEVAFIPEGEPSILGRGDPGATARRLRFVRQRPGRAEATTPLEGKGISRDQLRIQVNGGAIELERVGRCPVAVNGAVCERARVMPGDTVLLKGQLLLLCTRRPRELPALRHFPAEAVRGFGQPDAHGLIGEGAAAWSLRERLAFCARADSHALLLGPSGTGKELAARAIHALSPRAERPMVARNAATLPGGLIDAELFGNVRNYPNPGMPERPGLIGQAHGGILFLDEIGELPPELAAHLLRVIDEGGDYHRLGESVARRADLRLLAATNREARALKHDLVARLTLRVTLPGLEERREDIPLLVAHLLRRAARRSPDVGKQFLEGWNGDDGEPRVDPALLERLARHQYTLHVRELDALLWRAMAGSTGEVVTLAEEVVAQLADPAPRDAASLERLPAGEPGPDDIRASLERNGGNLVRAARALGLPSRFALYRLVKKHGLDLGKLRS